MQLFATPWTVALQAALPLRFSRQAYWSRLPFPFPGGLHDLEIEPTTLVSLSSVQFSSVAQSFLTLCDTMNHSTPGLPVHHHLLEFTQIHAHRVGDAIQPSHPLLSPFPPCPQSLPASGSFPMSQLFP